MKRLLTTTMLFALCLGTAPLSAQTQEPGMRMITVPDGPDARGTDGFLWYPAASGGDPVRALGNQVWEAIRVLPDADPAPGRYPLVVLSHGMFGNARNQAWLAEGLVRAGFVVAAIDHPGTSTFQRDARARTMLWERPRDISRAIDLALADPAIGGLVDPERIYMAGHSLGGFTAMLLAGARYDADHLGGFCGLHPSDLVCGIFDDWQVARTAEDRAAMEADLADPRIRAFAVFDLGGTQALSPDSVAAIRHPLLVYGAPEDIHGIDLDVESRALAAALPVDVVTYREPAGLAHFDFLGVCTENALAILREEEPDDVVVCEDGRESRQAEHESIIADVTAYFQEH